MFLLGWSFSGAQESVGTEQMPRDGDRSELEPESDGGTRIKDVLEWNPREFWGISSRTGKTGSRSMSILLTKARGTTPMECPALELPKSVSEDGVRVTRRTFLLNL